MTPAEAAARGRLGAHVRWSGGEDRVAATAAARRAFIESFERQVDPDGLLDPVERARRADHARRAHMQRIAMKAAKSRKRKQRAVGT